MNHFPEVLQQDVLKLRPPNEGDLGVIINLMTDDRVARWLAALPQPFDKAAARTLLEYGQDDGQTLRLIEWQGETIGGLCLGVSLWYWMNPDFWRRGLTRRALSLALEAWFSSEVPPLYATSHIENAASRSMLTSMGFSLLPKQRRMFFQSTQSSELCCDYVMAPEQWHLLHPLKFRMGSISISPATQADVMALSHILPTKAGAPWPIPENLPAFIERHRFRGLHQGLFKIEDQNRRTVGAALVFDDDYRLFFLSQTDETKHRFDAQELLDAWQTK